MSKNRLRQSDKDSILRLQVELDGMRRRLKIGDRGEVLFRAEMGLTDDIFIVEADGFGGAALQVVEGNYPIDYIVRDERIFSTEDKACREAERLLVESDE